MALVLDAVSSPDFYLVKSFSRGRISETVFEEIFFDLDQDDFHQDDIVSIIFLMTNYSTDIPAVLDAIKNDRKNKFFEITKEENWREKFLEALITTANIDVVIKLGFKNEEINAMKTRYSYNIHNVSENLNRIVKSLYFLCKELTDLQVKKLVKEVYEDLKEPVPRLTEEKILLEIYILDWLQKKYISIDEANPKLNKFIDILKINGLLVVLPPSLNFESWKDSNKNQKDSSEASGQSLQLRNGKNIINMTEKVPWAHKNHKRLCVIVNQVKFTNTSLYHTRTGSDTDDGALNNTFKGLQFDILQKRNLTAAGMIELLNSLSEKEYNNYAAIFLCILSHGRDGEVIFSDDNSVKVEKIRRKVCCRNLKNVFKFIILQSCQGKKIGFIDNKLTFDSPAESKKNRQLMEDSSCIYQKHFGLYQATVNEYVSIRHETEGSWFIQDACDELIKTTPIALTDWVKNVNKRVNDRKAETDVQGTYIVQVPCLTFSTISEDYEFPEYNNNL